MRVTISDFARQEICKTAKYILIEFGATSKDKFMKQVRRIRKLIGINPYIGIIEPSLKHLKIEYRSVVVSSLNKMIYYVKEDTISVVDFWDCRRDPNALVSQVK